MPDETFTVPELEQMFRTALRAGDAWGVVSALTVMAPQDPRRAAELLEATKVALSIAKSTNRTGDDLGRPPGRLVIICGLPGSGKTTRARRYVAESLFTRIRSNRDDMRDSAFGGRTGDQRHEEAITAAQHEQIRAWLRYGWEVVVDDTNLHPDHSSKLMAIAYTLGVEVEVWDLTYVDVETCIAQDSIRAEMGERYAGEEVIRDMHREWLQRRIFQLRDAAEQARCDMVDRYDQMYREGTRQWPVDDPITVTVDHACQVLADSDLRSRIEELAEKGRQAGVVIVLVDVVDGVPGSDDLGGSGELAHLLGPAGANHVRYRRVVDARGAFLGP